MILLVTDTSGRQGNVALARVHENQQPSEVSVIEEVPLAGGNFSAQLVPQIAALLAKQGLRNTHINAFVVVSGPGSFTGLRVGLAAIKGLAEVLQKPIVPVSLLEVLAVASGTEGKVLSALDAGRGEVYAGEYQVGSGPAHLVTEQLLEKNEFLSAGSDRTVVAHDPAWAAIARDAGLAVVTIAPPGAEMIARLGWQKLKMGQTVTPEQLEANYIRRSDAEIFAKPVARL